MLKVCCLVTSYFFVDLFFIFQSRKATYNGATPDQLMKEFFAQSSCSYRVNIAF